MEINGVIFNASLEEILDELASQMIINNLPYLQKRKRAGGSIQVCCPYHKDGQERKPSAGIRETDGKFHCFTCGEIHELQEVISFCFGYPDDILGKFGWNWLLKNFATMQKEERKDVELDYSRRGISLGSGKGRATGDSVIIGNSTGNSNTERNSERGDKYISEEELDRYRYYHPYWTKRGITNEKIIELFDLGYDKATKCITFPVRDIHGNCLFVARRSVQTKFFNYPEGVEKPLYGLYEYVKVLPEMTEFEPFWGNEVIICESMIDALTCWEYGKPAMALNGLGNERQFKELRQLPCRKLILATDADKAGREARKRLRKNISGKLITEYVWDERLAKDINDMDKEMFLNLKEIF